MLRPTCTIAAGWPPGRPQRAGPICQCRSQRRVCIIGGGAAGCAAAWSLSRHPDKYQVEVWEAGPRLGGHGSTLTLTGGLVMNDCVLGGTYSGFNNTLALLHQLGWTPHHEDFQVVFAHNSAGSPPLSSPAAAAAAAAAAATAPAATAAAAAAAAAAADAADASLAALQAAAWGTHSPDSPLFAAHARDIRVLTAALRWLWDTKQLLVLLMMPLRLLCRLLLCSDAFWQQMVAPIGVVFFGTGQQMGSCPVIILAGALFDTAKGVVPFEPDSSTLIKQGTGLPFFNFPRMDCFYRTFSAAAAATGNVTFRTSHAAAAVHLDSSRSKTGKAAAAVAASKQGTPTSSASGSSTNSSAHNNRSSSSGVLMTDTYGQQHCFDDVILAVHSKAALALLDGPSRLHTAALSGVEYHTQSTIMHTDADFIKRRHPLLLQCQQPAWHVQQLTDSTYELVYQFSTQRLQQCSQQDARVSSATAAAAAEAARQHVAAAAGSTGGTPAAAHVGGGNSGASGSSSSGSGGSQHCADPAAAAAAGSGSSDSSGSLPAYIWQVALPGPDALSEIDPSKVLSVKTYEHPSHTVAHFLRTLALMPRIQGAGGVYFAGGWTFVDAHEFALISGLAAAERLGSPYPFEGDPQAEAVYRAYVDAVHGVKRG